MQQLSTHSIQLVYRFGFITLQWRHNEHDGVSNHQPNDCLLNRLFRRSSKKTSKFRVTGLCEGNSPVTGEFPAQRASNAEKVSIRWRNHASNHNMYMYVSAFRWYLLRYFKIQTVMWQNDYCSLWWIFSSYFLSKNTKYNPNIYWHDIHENILTTDNKRFVNPELVVMTTES